MKAIIMQILIVLFTTLYVLDASNMDKIDIKTQLKRRKPTYDLPITLTVDDISGEEGMKGSKLSSPRPRINGQDISSHKGLLRFRMICSGTGATYFEMNSRTGDVYLKQDFDADKGIALITPCVVTVRDDKYNVSGSTDLTITIHDANDNAPTFHNHVMYVTVNCRTSVGSVIADLSQAANDDDVSDAHNAIAYALIPKTLDDDYFLVNEERKIIVNKRIFNCVEQTIVKMTITATDHGGYQDAATIVFVFLQDHQKGTSSTTRMIVFSLIVMGIYCVIVFKRKL